MAYSTLIPRNLAIKLVIIAFLAMGYGCKSKSDHQAKYSLYILAKDGKEYLLTQNTLEHGIIKPEASGVVLDGKDMDRDVFVKNGFFYHLNRKTALFSKFFIESGLLKTSGALTLKDFSIENFNWVNQDTLLLTGLNLSGYNQTKYALIEIKTMKVIAAGNLQTDHPSGKFSTQSIGFVEKRKNQLFVGYTYHAPQGISNYFTSDTFYVAEIAYPVMKKIKTEKDVRSTYPGGQNTIQSYGFVDQHSDYYFMSCPGIALGNRPEMPTGIFRIKTNEDRIDQHYFFDISAKLKNHAYGMWYLGGNKAIIRAERKDLYKDLNDHYSTAHFEFYIIDLQTQSAKKLNLPLDKGTRRECVIVEGNTAYISVNSTTEGNFIWLYNIKTGTLKKGLQLAGDTDFIMRIDRLTN
ncbi:hypothetical protein [Pedobacter sp. N23S346]|uniref:hypothetical protein n=1 Tax=Pedobacter sp. N23S346 TaxID=3402750 RepID=UPI003ACCF048